MNKICLILLVGVLNGFSWSDVGNFTKDLVTNGFKKIGEEFKNDFEKVKDGAEKLFDKIKEPFVEKINLIKNELETLKKAL
jgi:hypothetical protein